MRNQGSPGQYPICNLEAAVLSRFLLYACLVLMCLVGSQSVPLAVVSRAASFLRSSSAFFPDLSNPYDNVVEASASSGWEWQGEGVGRRVKISQNSRATVTARSFFLLAYFESCQNGGRVEILWFLLSSSAKI